MDFETARNNMVDSQIRPLDVRDEALIDAFRQVPRERFVPHGLRGVAYVDEDLRIGHNRYLTEPRVLARLLETARIGPEEVMLDVGCGSGYGVAVAARLANMVVGLERDPQLARQASETLAALGIDNAAIIETELTRGYPEQGPYDVILVHGAVAELPEAIIDQLGEGGRLVTVLAPPHATPARPGQGVAVYKTGGSWSWWPIFDAHTPYLRGFEPPPGFVF